MAGGAVLRVPLDTDLTPGAATELVPASARAVAVAADRQDNVYACTAEGVQVLDDEGEPIALVSLPAPPTGCCFGGAGGQRATAAARVVARSTHPTLCRNVPSVARARAGLSTLFITAGDGVWSLTTNVQGAAPPSEAFQRMMDKYVSAGDFRHGEDARPGHTLPSTAAAPVPPPLDARRRSLSAAHPPSQCATA